MAPQALAHVLRPLRDLFHAEDYPSLLVGLNVADDAAIYQINEEVAVIQTLDFFTPVVDDPYDYGAIAAANACSDVYAMGGEVVLALNICGFPTTLPPTTISEILRGGAEKVKEAGGVIAGGHTIDDDEPKYGLAVMGLVHPQRILTKGGGQPGDTLLLTKPLGVGIITTAFKADAADPAHLATAVTSMKRLNRRAAQLLREVGLHACTDITGFGAARPRQRDGRQGRGAAALPRGTAPLPGGRARLCRRLALPRRLLPQPRVLWPRGRVCARRRRRDTDAALYARDLRRAARRRRARERSGAAGALCRGRRALLGRRRGTERSGHRSHSRIASGAHMVSAIRRQGVAVWTAHRESWWVALGLALLVGLFLGDALTPPSGQILGGHDVRGQFFPWLTWAAESLRAGRLPLWDPYTLGGYPFFSNPQVGFFYPPAWLAFLLPVRIGLSLYVAWHLWWAGLGMWLFVRRVSGSRTGALLAALTFTFSGFAAARLMAGHIGMVATASWLPWILVALLWSIERADVPSGLLAGLPLGGAILAGNTTLLFYMGLIWLAFAAYLFLPRLGRGQPCALGRIGRQRIAPPHPNPLPKERGVGCSSRGNFC